MFSRPILQTILSAVLLVLAFPQTDWWILSWIGLVPLMFAIDGKSAKQSFGLAYLTGLMFFWGTLYWFVHVTWIGAFFLMAYLALYFGVFGLGYFYVSRWSLVFRTSQANDQPDRQAGERHMTNDVIKNSCVAALWVCLEFIRGHLFSGFDWVSLAHSQYENLWLIQIADITGVYGISFLIVFANCVIKDAIAGRHHWRKSVGINIALCITMVAVAGLYGRHKCSAIQHSQALPSRVAVVQANIAQNLKSSPAEWPDNFDRHVQLTFEAAKQNPDLIIWPETALPGYMWEDYVFIEQIKMVVRGLQTPLLLGAVTERDKHYFNSAILISSKGELVQQYNKIHLVPFGEYVPFRKFLPRAIEDLIPVEDFSSGTNFQIFTVDGKDRVLRLSALICFEDTLARLTRKFTSAGTGFLVNITNDGWFKDTNAPFLHLQTAVFRTIENRRTLVRAANTGVSCAVDPSGKITDVIQNSHGKQTFVEGWKVFSVNPDPYTEKTFYMRFGDLFVYACFGLLVFFGMIHVRRRMI